MPIKHTFTSVIEDGVDNTLVQPSDWNADHTGSNLIVEEVDGTPTISGVVKIKVASGTLTDDGSGVVSLDFSGSGMTNPMTTSGDIIYGGASGVPTRLAKGTEGYVLTMGATNPAWADGGSGSGIPLDGWIDANETWTYASATTITVPSGAASKYAIGDRIKLTQTTVKYFVVVTVADTVLTVTGGSDYSVANAAITNNYYSHVLSPIGFPQWFAWTPTLNTGNADLPGYDLARFNIVGRMVNIVFEVNSDGGSKVLTGTAGQIYVSLPIIPIRTYAHAMHAKAYDSATSAWRTIRVDLKTEGYIYIHKTDQYSNWAANEGAMYLTIVGGYEF